MDRDPSDHRHSADGDLAGRRLVLVSLAGRNLVDLVDALEDSGASVLEVQSIERAQRAVMGSGTAVVVDAKVVTRALHAGLRALGRQAAVIVLTPGGTVRERTEMLHSGADHVLPSHDPDEVVATLVAVLRRSGSPVAGGRTDILRTGDITLHLLDRTATAAGRTLDLTFLEFDLLAYFLAHPGEALSRDRLLAEVWGYDVGGRDTVTVHVRRLRTKIEADPARPTLLRTVRRIGYRLDPQSGTVSSDQDGQPRSRRWSDDPGCNGHVRVTALPRGLSS